VLPGPLASQTTSSDCTTRRALPDSVLTYWEVALPGAGGIAVGEGIAFRSRRMGSVRVQGGGDAFTSCAASADASNGLLGEPVDESREDGGQPRRRGHDP
jgi:hypothetical protein